MKKLHRSKNSRSCKLNFFTILNHYFDLNYFQDQLLKMQKSMLIVSGPPVLECSIQQALLEEP